MTLPPFLSRIPLIMWVGYVMSVPLSAQPVISPTALVPSDARSMVYLPSVWAFEEQVHTWGQYSAWEALERFDLETWIEDLSGHQIPLLDQHGLVYAQSPSQANSDEECSILVVAPSMLDYAQEVYTEWGPTAPPIRCDPYLALNLTQLPVLPRSPSLLGCGLPEALLSVRLSREFLFGAPRNMLENVQIKLRSYARLKALLSKAIPGIQKQVETIAKMLAFKLLPAIEHLTLSLDGGLDEGSLKVDCTVRKAGVLDGLLPSLNPQDQAQLLGALPLRHSYQLLVPAQLYAHFTALSADLEPSSRVTIPPSHDQFLAALISSLSGAKLSSGGHLALSWGTSAKGLEVVGVVQAEDGIAVLDHAIEALSAKPWRENGLRWIFGAPSELEGLKLVESTLYVLPGHFDVESTSSSTEDFDPVGNLERIFNCPQGLRLRIAASSNAVLISAGLSHDAFMECASGLVVPPSKRFLNEDARVGGRNVVLASRANLTATMDTIKWVEEQLNGEPVSSPPLFKGQGKFLSITFMNTPSQLSIEVAFRAEPALRRILMNF